MKRIISFALFLISFVVYLKTLCPTVYVGDSGELIAAAYTLGIPHPPGYPLYCLLGKLFTFLPFGSIAYRINLMSAFFASLTVVLIYLIVLKIQNTGKLANWQTGKLFTSHIPAISASLLFAFSLAFWSQAVVAEVYALNAFFLSFLILILLHYWEKRSIKLLYLFSLTYGIAFSAHLMQVTFLPAFLLIILITQPKIFVEQKNLLVMSGLFLLGFCLYLYLPLRSLANPPIDWGNPENLRNFWYHITVKQYRIGYLFSLSLPQILNRAKETFFLFLRQFSIAGLLIGLLGIGRLFQKRKLGLFFILIILGNLFYILFLNTISLKITAFGIPSYVIIAVGLGCGINWLLEKGVGINENYGINLGGGSLYKYVASLLILLLPLLSLSRNYCENDRSRYYLAYDYGMNILKTLKKDAILFSSGDNPTFTTAYLTMVKKERPDVTIYHRSGNLYRDIYGFSQLPKKELTAEKKRRRRSQIEKKIISGTFRPVYYIRNVSGELSDYSLRPEGLLYRVQREEIETKNDHNYWNDYQMRGIEDERIFKDYSTRGMIAEYCYRMGRYYSRNKKREEALTAYLKAHKAGWIIEGGHIKLGLAFQEEGEIEEAMQEFERSIELDPFPLISGYNNLGACYALKGQYQKAENIWKKALSIDPENEKVQKNLERLKGMESNNGRE